MKEFSITLDAESKTPLYEQIYEAVRDAILEGRISQGEKLPSTRFQAEYLQVSRSTVELAYAQLLSEGYIHSEPYRGYFACDVGELYQLANLADSGKESEKRKKENTVSYRVDFSPNGMDLSHFPSSVMSRIMKNVWLDGGEQVLENTSSFGDDNLRQAICDYLYRSRNVRCRPEQIVVGAGNEYLQILLAQMLGRYHEVAMESPTYLRAYRTFQNLGFRVSEVELDEEGMRIDRLEASNADIAYVMPSHQFPLGIVMPMKRRLELLKWATQMPGRYIIEDDYDSEFRYRGKPVPALQGIDGAGRVIYLGTFSKSIAPAIRVSYMVLPQLLLDVYRERCGFYACTVPGVMQQAIYHFMQEGFFEKNLNRMRAVYKGKHDVMVNELKNYPWISRVLGGNSGLHLVVELDTAKTEHEIAEACVKRGVRMYGLSEYFIGSGPAFSRPVFLLGYGGLEESQMREGLQILDEVLKNTRNR